MIINIGAAVFAAAAWNDNDDNVNDDYVDYNDDEGGDEDDGENANDYYTYGDNINLKVVMAEIKWLYKNDPNQINRHVNVVL